MAVQERMPRIPTDKERKPRSFVPSRSMKPIPRVMEAIKRRTKKATETWKWRRPEDSGKMPMQARNKLARRRMMDPTRHRRLWRSALARAMENKVERIPPTMSPELKIGATGETPRSLRALWVQLNQCDKAIETTIEKIV